MGDKERIREFILAGSPDVESLPDDADIFERGLVQSMFVMQLLVFVEREFDITIGPDDLDFDNFRTIDRIDELVSRNKATI